MKNWLNKYKEGGEPKPMSWIEYLDALGINDPKLRSIDPKSKLDSGNDEGGGQQLKYDRYWNASMQRPHANTIFEDVDNLKAAKVIDMYNALFWNREKQDYSGSDYHKFSDLPSDKIELELSSYADHSMYKKDALNYIKNFYNSPAEDILPSTFNLENSGSGTRAVRDVPIEYTHTAPRADLIMYNNPNWERDNPLFSEDKSMEVFNSYDSSPLSEHFARDWKYEDPNSWKKTGARLEFQEFPKPAYNYVNVPKRYDEKGNEVVSKYDVPNPKANTYYDFSGSLTEDIYKQKNKLHQIYKQNVANLKKFDPNAYPSLPMDRDLRREYIEKEYASDPYLFYGDQNGEDKYCTHCEKLSGSQHSTDNNIDFFKFKPQYPSSREWLIKTSGAKPPRPVYLSQPNATSTGQVQIGWDIWDPKLQQWKVQHFDTEEINRRREEVKVPKDGGRDIEFKDSVIHDLAPYSLPSDIKPGTVIDTNNKPVIKEPKVVKAPTFKSGGWLDTYDSMTPRWSKNPEGNWVVKAQKGLQYTVEPTRADSLELLKNTRLVQDYYNSKNYTTQNPTYFKTDNDKKSSLGFVEEEHKAFDPTAPRTTPAGISQKVSLDEYYKPVDKNKFYQREYANGILDTRAPMQLYDRRILPTAEFSYENDIPNDVLHGDNVGIIGYDPISITPWDMLTDKQKKLRVKRFGRNGVPEDYDPEKRELTYIKPIEVNSLPSLYKPEDRLIREFTVQQLNPIYREVYDQSPYSLKEYGPEGKFSHYAKQDEKIPGVWRPVKGKPSDLYASKKVKFNSGGWLDTYQNAGEVKTYANDPSYFDNRAIYHDDSRFNDLIRSKVYAGTHGWDPKTNSLVKLDKPVAVPESVREMSTAEWGKKSHKQRFESNTPAGKEVRKSAVAQSMKDMVENPAFYAPGAIAAGVIAGPAIGSAVGSALNAPLTIGSTVVPGFTMANAIGAGFAADAAVNRLPQIPGQLSRGEYMDAGVNALTSGLDIATAGMFSPLYKGASKYLRNRPSSLSSVVDQSPLQQIASSSKNSILGPGFKTDPYFHLDRFNAKKSNILQHLESPEGRKRLQQYINDNLHLNKYSVDDIIDRFRKMTFTTSRPHYRGSDASGKTIHEPWYEKQIDDLIKAGTIDPAYKYDPSTVGPNAGIIIDKNGNLVELNVEPESGFHWAKHGPGKPSVMNIGSAWSPYDAEHILEHEFGHFFQNESPLVLDHELTNIELKNPFELMQQKSPSYLDVFKDFTSRLNPFTPYDKGYSVTSSHPGFLNANNSARYWKAGSQGMEKTPFAAEIRENLLQRGLIKDRYEPITHDLLRQHHKLYDKTKGDKYRIRLYDVMTKNEDNYKWLSHVLNKMPAAVPVAIGAGALMKEKDGGWLTKYQNGSQVKTYASDPSYFDNRAVYHDDSRFNDLIRSKVYAGTHGWDATTNSLVKLDKPVVVPKSVQQMSTADWGKKSHQERVTSKTPAGKETRKAIAAKDMEQAVTNPYFRGAIPAMMLPGVPALGEAAYAGLMSTPVGAATAGALATDIAPGLTVGTLGQGLVDSYFAAKAPGQLMTANQNFRSGDIMEGAANTGLAAMNLFPFYQYMPKAQGPGPLMILDDAGKGISRAKGDEPHLSEWQKLRIAEGKPVYTGSNPEGNMTMREIQAQKDLQKSVKSKTKPKKLSKEEEYERLLRESYQRTGGSIKGYQDGGDYSKIPQSWKDKYDWTPNVEEEYQKFKNDYMAPENLKFTDDLNDYNTRGMWDSLDRPSDWQQALALYKQQQGEDWTPEEDGYYHAWSQHPGTGEWLKPKHHSTGWMNYMGYAFDPENTAVVNPEGFFGNETLQAYPRQKKKGGVKSSAEGYYDYINGYSGIFAQGGTKGWLDNYK